MSTPNNPTSAISDLKARIAQIASEMPENWCRPTSGTLSPEACARVLGERLMAQGNSPELHVILPGDLTLVGAADTRFKFSYRLTVNTFDMVGNALETEQVHSVFDIEGESGHYISRSEAIASMSRVTAMKGWRADERAASATHSAFLISEDVQTGAILTRETLELNMRGEVIER